MDFNFDNYKPPYPFREGKHYDVDPETGCWNWKRYSYMAGVRKDHPVPRHGKDGIVVPAARTSYEWKYGPLTGFCCHKCDNPLCVNPDHLYDGNQTTNMRDMRNRGRQRQQVMTEDRAAIVKHFINQGYHWKEIQKVVPEMTRSIYGHIRGGSRWAHVNIY